MTVNEVVAFVKSVKPSRFTDAQLIEWVNELERFIQIDVWLLDAAEVTDHHGSGAASEDIYAAEPFTDMYHYYLAYKIDFFNGEYNKAANTREAFDEAYTRYKMWFFETYEPVQAQPQMLKLGEVEFTDVRERDIFVLRPGDILRGIELRVTEPFVFDDANAFSVFAGVREVGSSADIEIVGVNDSPLAEGIYRAKAFVYSATAPRTITASVVGLDVTAGRGVISARILKNMKYIGREQYGDQILGIH